MKKIFVLLLATAMIFALAACGATPNETDNNNTQDDHQAETPDASYEAPQITELYNEDFDYTDGIGNSGHYIPTMYLKSRRTHRVQRPLTRPSPMRTPLS